MWVFEPFHQWVQVDKEFYSVFALFLIWLVLVEVFSLLIKLVLALGWRLSRLQPKSNRHMFVSRFGFFERIVVCFVFIIDLNHSYSGRIKIFFNCFTLCWAPTDNFLFQFLGCLLSSDFLIWESPVGHKSTSDLHFSTVYFVNVNNLSSLTFINSASTQWLQRQLTGYLKALSGKFSAKNSLLTHLVALGSSHNSWSLNALALQLLLIKSQFKSNPLKAAENPCLNNEFDAPQWTSQLK